MDWNSKRINLNLKNVFLKPSLTLGFRWGKGEEIHVFSMKKNSILATEKELRRNLSEEKNEPIKENKQIFNQNLKAKIEIDTFSLPHCIFSPEQQKVSVLLIFFHFFAYQFLSFRLCG